MPCRRTAFALLLALGATLLGGPVAAATTVGIDSGVMAAEETAGAGPTQGWWTATNTGGPLPAPPTPDVPDDGLLVEGGPQAPRAYAALVYTVPVGATTVDLRLAVAEGSATTQGAVLRACVLTKAFEPTQGGTLAKGPTYDCARMAETAPVGAPPAAASYTLDVAALVEGDLLAIALVPADPAARVVFAAPGPDAVEAFGSSEPATAPDAGGSSGTSDSFAPVDPVVPPVFEAPVGDAGTALSSFAEPALTPIEAPVESAVVAPVEQSAPVAQAIDTQPVAEQTLDQDGNSTRVVALLLGALVMAMATLWAFAGQPTGVLQSDGPPTTA